MPYTRPWNASTPVGTLAASSIDEAIREKLVDIKERMDTVIGGTTPWTSGNDPVVNGTTAKSLTTLVTDLAAKAAVNATTNTIPKKSGSNFTDSSISDDGTTVTIRDRKLSILNTGNTDSLQPYVGVYVGGNPNPAIADGASAAVAYAAEFTSDLSSMWDGINTTRITIPVTGLYRFDYVFNFYIGTSASSGDYVRATIRKDGVAVSPFYNFNAVVGGRSAITPIDSYNMMTIPFITFATAGQYFDLYVENKSGFTITYTSYAIAMKVA